MADSRVRGTDTTRYACNPCCCSAVSPPVNLTRYPYDLQVVRMIGESQEPVGAGVGGGSQTSNKTPTLEEYGTNLTSQAEEVCP
jgi:hypothetical protein